MSKRLDRFDSFSFFVIVIYTAMAIPATKSMVRPSEGGIIAYLIPWGLTIILALRHKVSFLDRRLVKVLFIYLIWVALQTLRLGYFYLGSFIFLGNILIAYLVIRVYSWNMLILFEKIVVGFSIIGLFLWAFWVIAPGPFSAFMRMTSFSDLSTSYSVKISNLLYTMNTGGTESSLFQLPRNSGFSWEPGRYSVMLVLSIYFNLLRTHFSIRGNRNLLILTIALLTTQSTTGFGAFLFVLFLFVLNSRISTRVTLTVLLVPLIAMSFYLPFMGDKIAELSQQDPDDTIESADYREKTTDQIIVPQRIVAITFELMNIKDAPVLGYGVSNADSYVQRSISSVISLPGGAFGVISQFGIIIGFLVYLQLFRASTLIAGRFGAKGKWGFFVLFVLLSISYSLWQVPIFMSLWLLPVFNNYKRTYGEASQIYRKSFRTNMKPLHL